jgi:hypothetical protein
MAGNRGGDRADSLFTSVFVSLARTSHGLSTSSDTGLGAYYEVTLPSPQMTAAILLAFPQELRNREFELFFAVASSADAMVRLPGWTSTCSRLAQGTSR